MQDIHEISVEHGLEKPPAQFTHSNRLKEKLLGNLGETIQFTKIGNKNAMHSSDVSPLAYTEATLKEHGLREDDTAKTFAENIRRKLSEKERF